MPETQLNSLTDFDLRDKKLFMRVDFNIPIKDGKVLDSYRIDKAMPSIQYALDQGAKVVLASHLGRPKGRVVKALSLQPVAQLLTEKYNLEVIFLEEPDSDVPHALLRGLKNNQVILLNNLRFHKGEEEPDKAFARQIASYTDIYVNEGFSISHRKDTSVFLLPEMIPDRCIGFQFQKEIEGLDNIRLKKTEKPFFVFLGGSKVRDKIFVLENLIDQTDEFFIGGMIAYSFLKAQDFSVGDSYVDKSCFPKLKMFIDRLEKRGKKLWLPIDHVVVKGDKMKITEDVYIEDGYKGLDIGPKTRALFCNELKRSSSLFWNGPMGYFEREEFSGGTKQLAQTIAEHSKAYRVVGGGHSALAAREYEDQINHVSTGGGASLSYLAGNTLPGLQNILTRVYDLHS